MQLSIQNRITNTQLGELELGDHLSSLYRAGVSYLRETYTKRLN